MTRIRFSDGATVDVIDRDCEFRPCFRLGFDKGSFTPGRGYTSYHRDSKGRTVEYPVCMTRHLNGCPHVGVHLRCRDCTYIGDAIPIDAERTLPGACPNCGGTDLYWLADVLHPPSPCCDTPRVASSRKGSLPHRQRCLSCGTWLRGARLDLARGSA